MIAATVHNLPGDVLVRLNQPDLLVIPSSLEKRYLRSIGRDSRRQAHVSKLPWHSTHSGYLPETGWLLFRIVEMRSDEMNTIREPALRHCIQILRQGHRNGLAAVHMPQIKPRGIRVSQILAIRRNHAAGQGRVVRIRCQSPLAHGRGRRRMTHDPGEQQCRANAKQELPPLTTSATSNPVPADRLRNAACLRHSDRHYIWRLTRAPPAVCPFHRN